MLASVSLELKPRAPWASWPKGKKCDHVGTGRHTYISSDGWGMPYNKRKTVCRRCGTLLHEEPYSGN